MPCFSRTGPMISRSMTRRFGLFAALLLCLFSALPAAAHPHVFVTVKSTIVFENGVPKAVRHNWRFDDMFSAFAVQGLDTDTDGKLSRAELQALAQVNVTSLKEFDFFTFGAAGSGDLTFTEPVDYWLEHDGTALTLHFTLPVTSAMKSETTRIEIYDPSYFVSFSLAEQEPAALEGASADCRVDVEGPQEGSGEKLTEDFFSNLDPEQGWGKKFANAFVVRCGEAAIAYAASIPPKVEAAPIAADDGAAASRVEQALKIAEAQPLQEMPEPAAKAQDNKAQDNNKALGAFGVVPPEASAVQSRTGFFGWIAAQQATFYKAMADALTASKENGSALLLLAALSFSYGVFHAAGPGHGKAVISSYLLATGETLKRGIAISFAAAIAQAITAIVVVGIFAVLLGVTSQAMGVAAWWLEAASYGLIVLLGVGVIFRRSLIPLRGHVHDENCDHSHGPRVEDLDGEFGWRRAAAAVLAVGLRPCTGALLILVFALAQGLIWTGIAATFAMALGTAFTVAVIATLAVTAKEIAVKLASGASAARTRRTVRVIEITAGFAVLTFGLILLGGLMQAGVPAAAAG
jgi:nickel/cobalt transporter (NicO) family protein